MRLQNLGYAATAYGVQGATVDASHTVLSAATSAAHVYVGMTRGRETNRLHVVAAVHGLIDDGPVRLVSDELARLDHEAERVERQAKWWEQAAARLDTQRAEHRAEDDENTVVLRKAEDDAARIRAEVAGPLTVQAEADGAAYLAAIEIETAASALLATRGGSAGSRPVLSTRPRPNTLGTSVRRCARSGAVSHRAPPKRYQPGRCRQRHDEPRQTRKSPTLTAPSKQHKPNERRPGSDTSTSAWRCWGASSGPIKPAPISSAYARLILTATPTTPIGEAS